MIPFTITMRQRLVTYERPVVMGIVNVTPDSFYAGSRTFSESEIAARVESIISQGADMIDVGACSTRPGSAPVDAVEEMRRIRLGLSVIRRISADIPVSVDTFRADVANQAIRNLGADIINDVSGGLADAKMMETVAALHCPYVLMHIRGTQTNMNTLTDYGTDVVTTVIAELQQQLRAFRLAGVADIIIDPGLGFAKTVEQNYAVLNRLSEFNILGCPILIGLSRKSMLTKPLGITADEALNATTASNVLALDRGAAILRVHDVAAACQARDIYTLTTTSQS